MSEIIKARTAQGCRGKLLVTVSVFALIGSAYSARSADSDGASHPPVWIELGWQFDRVSGGPQPFAPAFTALAPDVFASPLDAQKALAYSEDPEMAFSFQPDGSDWIFSASVRYGRASGVKHVHNQTVQTVTRYFKRSFPYSGYYRKGSGPAQLTKDADTHADNTEAHVIVDFQVGKDVGLGMFGRQSTSELSFGARFARISSKSDAVIAAQPDTHLVVRHRTFEEFVGYTSAGAPRYAPFYGATQAAVWHQFNSKAHSVRSFQGVGPSVSWNASAVLLGEPEDGALAFDWGANAAVLFGRQKASGQSQITAIYATGANAYFHHPFYQTAASHNRSKNVTVTNLGGVAGLSVRYSDVKVSFGYRGDFFFGAIDGGIATRKSGNRGFYGPFATISVGIGG